MISWKTARQHLRKHDRRLRWSLGSIAGLVGTVGGAYLGAHFANSHDKSRESCAVQLAFIDAAIWGLGASHPSDRSGDNEINMAQAAFLKTRIVTDDEVVLKHLRRLYAASYFWKGQGEPDVADRTRMLLGLKMLSTDLLELASEMQAAAGSAPGEIYMREQNAYADAVREACG